MIDTGQMWRALDGARGILDSYQNTQSEDARGKLEGALKIILDDASAMITGQASGGMTPADEDE